MYCMLRNCQMTDGLKILTVTPMLRIICTSSLSRASDTRVPSGKDPMFAFNQRDADMFSLPASGRGGGGVRGLPGWRGARYVSR